MLKTVVRQLRRVASALREKPDTKLDDYLLEHYIIYHGLSGTTPENLRQARHVKQDIADAVNHKSPVELCIALKLPPLYWQDKLPDIFSELKNESGDRVVACLLPPGNEFDLPPEADPLRHPDWRVRSNAARLLAHLQVHEAIPRMVQALNDDNPSQKASFCHIASSLGQMQTDEAQQALIAQLGNEEPWFVLDAMSALSNWPLNSVAHALAGALIRPNPFADYLAVAVAQKYTAAALLDNTEEAVQEGGLEAAIWLVAAAANAHSAEIPVQPGALHKCLPRLMDLARSKPHPRRLLALLTVSEWIKKSWQEIVDIDRSSTAGDLLRQTDVAQQEFSPAFVSEKILDWLKANCERPESAGESRHAATLAGNLKIADATPYLISLAEPRNAALEEAISALAQLECTDAAPHLLKLADQMVDLDDRTSRKLSPQPVFEDNPPAAKTYWRLLGALSAMPTAQTFEYLLRAKNDFAPDKRQQALQSLTAIAASGKLGPQVNTQVATCVEESFADPATPVKVAALKGVGDLKLVNLLSKVMPLVHVKDTALRRQAQATVRHLYESGFGEQVKAAIKDCIAQEKDTFKREQLHGLLNSLGA
jgi:HEAT repeat protein